ncbi:type II toxin-antitoxin system HipA family toxin [Corynebacterium sp. zg254]|uniref:Type II toxin-antitoxin system HipA family toxin n=1 Tax=Corynebacterium zhongnanshanii TaxID=2768834 RepID=A0ABQ6VCW5_9CORY|nr:MULTISPECIES: HipA domain-containing protein [Corynebacterium]KAB3520762.1 type II toxin-antitoxin system HipA family toxin [Corynebacterium zhongnanshanii]MCR5914376.1 type II toxin-antitoxin system HipA family toxin [Corynebacterium sp. zg254]
MSNNTPPQGNSLPHNSTTAHHAIHRADVWVGAALVGNLTSYSDGTTEFLYNQETLAHGGPAVATTFPVRDNATVTTGGALPAFFSNLLPEGRRLSTLKKNSKVSMDDELGLLLHVGANTIGNVAVVPQGQRPHPHSAQLTMNEDLDFTEALSSAGIVDPSALPGVQDKASARTIAAPTVSDGVDYILKVSPPEYPKLVENESACFEMIRSAKKWIPAASATVIHDKHGRSGLLVTRFDRHGDTLFPVEDSAQLLNIPPAAKYSPTMEDVASAILTVSRRRALDAQKIAYLVAFAWLTGNGDMHAKNISVINTGEGFELAPVYDIPSTLPYGDHTLALSVAGATDNLSGKKFLSFTHSIGLSDRAARTVMDRSLATTEGAAEKIIQATDFDIRRARDLRRVLGKRRNLWLDALE